MPAVAAALHCQRHRGPDESGTWNDEDLVFGFNRLSIIDIGHSHQPLQWGPADAPNRYSMTFNGEIYNYLELRAELAQTHGAQFHTAGDTESIVAGFHYWGPEVVNKLRGMFAFAIWDSETRELFLARDQFGIKPMFLATGAGGLLASAASASFTAGVQGFAAGALLVMLIDTMVPEAREEGGETAGLVTVVGFAIGAFLSLTA